MPKITKEQRIERIERVHPGKFSYECIENLATKDKKYTITCPTHGNFRKTMSNLINKSSGCPSCGNAKKGLTTKRTTNTFIKKANKVHENFYSYDNVDYKNSHTLVTITCPKHGDFSVKPYVHLAGHKCRKCAYDDNSIATRVAIQGKPTYFYYVKFPKQEIWKIGCSVDIPKRFHGIPYELLFCKLYKDSRIAYFVEGWILKATLGTLYNGSYYPIEKGRTELRSAPILVQELILEAEMHYTY
jgi:hypothetical protein